MDYSCPKETKRSSFKFSRSKDRRHWRTAFLIASVLACWSPSEAFTTVVSPTRSKEAFCKHPIANNRRIPSLFSSEDDTTGDENNDPPVVKSTVRFDDGGSDLTDRFKYKVNALMGAFDPQTGVDDEYQEGNILNAMLKFPVRYSFNVVAKTKGNDELKERYISQVKEVVGRLSGDADCMECRMTPRGKNFTRVTLQVTVDSVAVINSIYQALGDIEQTVMKY